MKNIRFVGICGDGCIYTADGFDWIWIDDLRSDEPFICSSKDPKGLTDDEIKRIIDNKTTYCYPDSKEDAEKIAELMGEKLECERVKISYRRYDPNTDTWDGGDPFVFEEGYTFKDFLTDNDIPFEEDETIEQRYYILDEFWGERTGVIYEVFDEEPTDEDITDDILD